MYWMLRLPVCSFKQFQGSMVRKTLRTVRHCAIVFVVVGFHPAAFCLLIQYLHSSSTFIPVCHRSPTYFSVHQRTIPVGASTESIPPQEQAESMALDVLLSHVQSKLNTSSLRSCFALTTGTGILVHGTLVPGIPTVSGPGLLVQGTPYHGPGTGPWYHK